MKSRPGVSKRQRTRSMKIQSQRGEEKVCVPGALQLSHRSTAPSFPSPAPPGESCSLGEGRLGSTTHLNLGMKGEWGRRKWCFPTMVGLCAWRQQEQCFGLGIPEKATLSSSLTIYYMWLHQKALLYVDVSDRAGR